MRKSIALLATTVISVTTLSLAGTALAQPGERQLREPTTRASAEARAASLFARLDANGDGVIDQSDRKARNEARREARSEAFFARADSNGDGLLSKAEFSAARDQRPDQRTDQRKARHAQDTAEAVAERPRGKGMRGDRMWSKGRGGPHGMARFGGFGPGRSADTDGDGKISSAEFSAAALARFDRADADGDGTVTAEERRAHWAAQRAKRTAPAKDGE